MGFQDLYESTCLGIYSLETRSIVGQLDDVHLQPINHLKWIEPAGYLVSCSNDMSINIFTLQDRGRQIRKVRTFLGHTDEIRCLKYLEREDLLSECWSRSRYKGLGP